MDRPPGGRFDDKYELLERLGHGNFGEVYRIREIATGHVFALKRIRTGSDASKMETIPPAAFNEIQAMYHLDHPNVVHLVDVIPEGASVGLVLEYMETDLAHLIANSTAAFSAQDTKSLMYMLLRGVECCHTQQILHRDIKPSNLLLDQHGVLKLSDFGLATVYTGPEREYAHQVATRWYRSPELLFGSRTYNHKVDMWAVGVVFAELLQHAPLFPGMNDIDQIFRVMQVLGSPTWPGMADLPDYHKVSFPVFSPLPLETLFADTDSIALDLLKHLLVYDPSQRLDAAEALKHPYFLTEPLPLPYIQRKVQARNVSPEFSVRHGGGGILAALNLDMPFFPSGQV
ncbi:CMGC/CDK protein kinase, variant 1 [Aphanomyces invadans]|uniref:Cyclin-dependent kinase 2 homolog n=2 Tax=Aphanomyces invadans TaxID=157072 RepID=A0A024THV5_9STRA|nr:CMGC/CDK protein kinase, variant 1 [Aphanomyces invadans]ETV93745.1 CMGC/CDK protein kinase, variant 1 [Aphanomyces invadans]|eukprot:XP_008877557.1 CMGC/CDK protein kinase, variant 1 [Aphanomyces invadans]